MLTNQKTKPQTRTMLYVEDNPANLLLVKQLFARRSNWKLLTAIDGYLGLIIAKENQPEVIIMDINLPGISGYDALKLLQADNTLAHIPVIALSSDVYPGHFEKGTCAGFFRYLTKPYKIDELMHALEDSLQYSLTNSE
jgi:CheY-like chemotaxis protein